MFRTVGLAALRRPQGAARFAQIPRRFQSSQAAEKMNFKQLAKKYGWVATGVYVGFSILDFPLCYLAVHSLGIDKFVDYEMKLREKTGYTCPRDETYVGKAAKSEHGRFLTELTVAYVIHKSLIIFRVPATISVTPIVAKKLASWGFKVGPAVAKTAGSAAVAGIAKGGDAAKHAAAETGKKEVTKRFGTHPTKAKRWFSGFL